MVLHHILCLSGFRVVVDNDAYDDATLVKVSTKCPPFPDSLKYELVSSCSEQFLISAVVRLFFLQPVKS